MLIKSKRGADMREWLKIIRKKHGLLQKEVAKMANISPQYYCYIEAGERGDKLPVNTAKKIAEVLQFNWQLFYEKNAS